MALTLKEVVPFLRRACEAQVRRGLPDLAAEAARLVGQAGNIHEWGFPVGTQDSLIRIESRLRGHESSGVRALALLAARIGQQEVEAANRAQRVSELDQITAPAAVAELFGSRTFSSRVPERHFLARMRNPRDGFDRFRTESGTRVAFFGNHKDLGNPWGEIVAPHLHDAVGLVLYDNQRDGAAGVISINSLGRLERSPVGAGVWGTSGGTMGKDARAVPFRRVVLDAVDKGDAMIDKWMAVDMSLRAARLPQETRMGGSKGHFVFAQHAREAGGDDYAEVVDLLGVQYTGSDEGVGPEWVRRLAKRAPDNFNGDPSIPLKGRFPTDWTARGIFAGAQVLFEKQFGTKNVPTLVQGAGGIGLQLAMALQEAGVPISAVVDARREALYAAKEKGLGAPLYRGGRGAHLSPSSARDLAVTLWDWARGIKTRWGLEAILREHPETRFVATNAGTHPLTFDNIATMIVYDILASGGSANNQLGLDTQGSPDAAAWILQAAGINHPADFVWNRLGATAVISGVLGLTDPEMEGQVRRAGDFVGEEYDKAFRKGIPPYIWRLRQARAAWAEKVTAGQAIGGVRPVV